MGVSQQPSVAVHSRSPSSSAMLRYVLLLAVLAVALGEPEPFGRRFYGGYSGFGYRGLGHNRGFGAYRYKRSADPGFGYGGGYGYGGGFGGGYRRFGGGYRYKRSADPGFFGGYRSYGTYNNAPFRSFGYYGY